MKERGLPFQAPMVRATRDLLKTQTRRGVKFPKWSDPDGGVEFSGLNDGPAMLCRATGCFADVQCPYGVPGDRLWVREAHMFPAIADPLPPREVSSALRVHYLADGDPPVWFDKGRYRHARFMPRWASRITLEVTEVRVERVCAISQADCIAEGIPAQTGPFLHHVIADFARLWRDINGPESWDANPWVWVVTFKRVG